MRTVSVTTSRTPGAHGLHLLPVSVNGRGPFPFALDTGAQLPILAPDLARELDLRPTEVREGHGAGGAVELGLAHAALLSVGALARRNVRVGISSEIHRIAAATGASLRGVLGYGWLSAFRLVLEARASRLELSVGAALAPIAPAHRAAFRLASADKPLLLVAGEADGHAVTWAVDTGASTSVLSESLAERHALARRRAAPLTGGGGLAVASSARLGVLSVAGVRATGLDVAVAPFVDQLAQLVGAPFDGIVGNDVLDAHRLTIDYPERWLALD